MELSDGPFAAGEVPLARVRPAPCPTHGRGGGHTRATTSRREPLRRALRLAAAAVLAAACSRTPAPREPPPERIVLVGDSIMGEVAAAVDAATTAEVHHVLTIGASAVADDWWDVWPRVVEEHRPDHVVVLVGPWDIDRPDIGSAEWHRWYGDRLDRWADLLTAGGAELLWIRPLPARDPVGDGKLAVLDTAVRRLAERRTDVRLVDTWRRYVERTDTGERIHRVDGLHLCAEGVERVARNLLEALGIAPDDRWERGPWRRREPVHSDAECP